MKGSVLILWSGALPTHTDGQPMTWTDVAAAGHCPQRFEHLDVRWPKIGDYSVHSATWRMLVRRLILAIGGMPVPDQVNTYWAPAWRFPDSLSGETARLRGFLNDCNSTLHVLSDVGVDAESMVQLTVETYLYAVMQGITDDIASEVTRRPSLYVSRLQTCDKALDLIQYLRSREYQGILGPSTLGSLVKYAAGLDTLRERLVVGLDEAAAKVHETCKKFRHKRKEVIPPGLQIDREVEPILLFGGAIFDHIGDNLFYSKDGGPIIHELAMVGMAHRRLSVEGAEVTMAKQGDGSGSVQIHGDITPETKVGLRSLGITYQESSNARSKTADE